MCVSTQKGSIFAHYIHLYKNGHMFIHRDNVLTDAGEQSRGQLVGYQNAHSVRYIGNQCLEACVCASVIRVCKKRDIT